MRKYVLAMAVFAAASLPALAWAEDAQKDAQLTGAAQLSDSEMDQVTAAGRPYWAGKGIDTAAYRLSLKGRTLPPAALANAQGHGKP